MSDASQMLKTMMPALRALEASRDGHWEADLADGSAWFSPWFYKRLGWSAEPERTHLGVLKDILAPASWEAMLRQMRAHLEWGAPLDFDVHVHLPGGERGWWRLRGMAQRNDISHPIRIVGTMFDVTDQHIGPAPGLSNPAHTNRADSEERP